MSQESEHVFFMKAALAAARGALDNGEFPVGCVMVADGEIIATGSRKNSRISPNEIDHAEVVTLRNLIETQENIDFSKVTVYTTMEPCLMCFSTLILSGIRSIVFGYEDVMGGGTALELGSLPPLYSEMDVLVIPHVLRDEALALFKTFFRMEQNEYWRDSYLARYTLEQS